MISVFKTNISTKEKIRYATPTIDNITEIQNWNFDIEDCDYILRIESENSISKIIIHELKKIGFKCLELE
ncbi:hypothetical protein FF125_02485 [Aureibaculum algae]|uniref:Uncharacterized protein n=1 Tax=Aureibaculum algae TaxID=2584122 RepID=A0A5B7TQY8_9FLAO|nr:hypothetical protein [Aureibaculum algae]QCX37357.1 hypothetical protein FF125_02485 [Aureibaculum algae]